MSSVLAARDLTRDLAAILAPGQGWKRQVSAVYKKLTDKNFEWVLDDLTWNRVKSWFFAEARRVDYQEMVALKELKAVEEARLEHREFVAKTTRLAQALAATGEALSREEMALLARLEGRSAALAGITHPGSRTTLRGLDRSRAGGDAR